MAVCWWHYSFPHAYPDGVGSSAVAVSAATMKAALLFTPQNIQNISSNELSLSQQNKDPSCHSERRVPSPGLPAVWLADVGMIIPSPELMSLFKSCLTAVISHRLYCVCGVKNKAWPRMHDSDLFFFFFQFLCFLLWYESWLSDTNWTRSLFWLGWSQSTYFWVNQMWIRSFLHWCSEGAEIPFVSGCFDFFFLLKTIFCCSLISRLCSILPQRDATLSDGWGFYF